MKGRTNSPLTIEVPAEWVTHPEVVKLAAAGHTITIREVRVDLILAPEAHQWNEHLWPLLPVALKSARARKADARRRQGK